MKEKELRLALVCGGGISLAVYIHGVTKEILKVVRASKAFHALADPAERRRKTYADLNPHGERESDTEALYFDILKTVGETLDLRVIVDVVGGASAGGINGIFLARALAHDLPIDHLRDLWLAKADVRELGAANGNQVGWYKWILRPILKRLPEGSLRGIGGNVEASKKLSALLPLRGMKPPFDGEKLLEILYQAIASMDEPQPAANRRNSLLPVRHELELFVTLTDFYGYAQHIPLDDPPMIEEREHRHILRFEYRDWPDGISLSEFSSDCIPALAFAARATSSFPGAFAPARISEVDRLLERLGKPWPGREAFLEAKFIPYRRAGMDPTRTVFMDGSVLNNRPFAEAIEAIRGHPAYRQVDRRLIYIDPHPVPPPPPPSGKVPGFWRSLKAALSDIPRNEPIHDDLAWIDGFNRRVRRAKTIVDAARPHIEALVLKTTGSRLQARSITADRVTAWRRKVGDQAAREVGFAYEGYVRLKLAGVLEHLASLINELCGHAEGTHEAQATLDILLAWAANRDVHPTDLRKPLISFLSKETPIWVDFLRRFDLDYRRRQIRFTIQTLNEIYGRLSEPGFAELSPTRIDRFKEHFYEALTATRRFLGPDFMAADTRALALELFASGTLAEDGTSHPHHAERYARRHEDKIDELIDALGRDLDLPGLSLEVDAIFEYFGDEPGERTVRAELLINYLGFAFWDITTFAITSWRDLGEFDEIRVARISPDDAQTIRKGGAQATLKGISLAHFGAFFSRRDRENDYLWGRLHGAERVIDMLVSAAEIEGAHTNLKPLALKKRAFQMILETEQAKLPNSARLLRTLRKEIAAIVTEDDPPPPAE